MDFAFSDEQNELRQLARKILGDLASNERLKDIEARETIFDEQLWRELGRANLLGLAIDESHGGLGFGYFELCILLTEIGRAVAPVPVVATALLAALPIAAFGSDAQKSLWLPKVAAGEAILTAALVELGSDAVTEVATIATQAADGFRLSGEKTLVPAAQLADRILVPARTGPSKSRGGSAGKADDIGLFLVDPSDSRVRVEPQQTCDRQPHAQLWLDGAVGEPLAHCGDGSAALQWLVERATVGLCALQLGVGERALEMTADYARERIQFDRPIGSFQAVHQRAADAFINMEAIRLSFFEAALLLAEGAQGDAVDDAIAVAKYWASEGGQFTAYACQHLHGGIGIDVDYPLHRYFIWSTQIEHGLGCASEQLRRLGARIAERGIVTPA